ncbi:MAG: hypothetical protein K1X57_20225 [Gemmataceae bacterium]|nr:hypothetical protein [Gemmataceae bacterium]
MAVAETPVRLEVRLPGSRPSFIEVASAEFLIGSVAGCDLVVPGAELPPVLGVIARTADGLKLRKLAPNLKMLVNGKAVHNAPLTNGDTIAVGTAEITVHIPAMAATPVLAGAGAAGPRKPWSFRVPVGATTGPASGPDTAEVDNSGSMRLIQQENDRLRQQARELESRRLALEVEEQARRQAWAEREAQVEQELDAARAHTRTTSEATRHETTARELELESKLRDVEQRERQQQADRVALEAEVRTHREDLVRMERQRAAMETRLDELARRELTVDQTTPLLEARTRELDDLETRLRAEQDELRVARAGIDTTKMQLAQRSAEIERQELLLKTQETRCDRAREDLGRYSHELAEQKARQDALDRELLLRQKQQESKHAELALREETAARMSAQLEERENAVQRAVEQVQTLSREITVQEADLKSREQRLVAERSQLEEAVKTHREDLVRLDRFRDALETRERQVTEKAATYDQQIRKLEDEARQLEDQSAKAALAEQRLRDEEARLRALQGELDAQAQELANKSASTDGNQAVLVAVRAKLERLRDELRVEAQSLADERGRNATVEQALLARQRELEAREAGLADTEKKLADLRHELDERTIAVEKAANELAAERQQQATASSTLAEQLAAAAVTTQTNTAQAATLREKAGQLLELQTRIEADRQSITEREAALKAAEQARGELQEQLLRRAEELAAKHRAADELAQQLSDRAAAISRDRQQVDADLGITRADLDARAAELVTLAQTLQEREDNCYRLADKLKEAGRTIAAERKARHEARGRWDEEYRAAAEQLAKTRAELEHFKAEAQAQAQAIIAALPGLETRGTAALDRLAQAREQLRHHVAELHEYAKQSYADLEGLREQVQSETERLRGQQTALAKARGDHRHAVTAFRQQLIDWQSRIAEMKSAMGANDNRLQQKAGELDEAAKEIEAAGAQLARQAAALQKQEEVVAKQRGVMEYHLTDMRDWFRRKLRELAESSVGRLAVTDSDAAILPGEFGSNNSEDRQSTGDEAEDIIAITQDLDPGDKKLGELLRSMELVDNNTLTTLLLEARRQRRSLRQVLLASGKLTVYQMALIEAGNVDGLTIGPLGVVDRLHATPYEAVYRVIDPRDGSTTGPAVLRHLSDSVMHDAVKPDEFRQRFAALVHLRHPHVAATIETLELLGRPAALQEWLTGLPSQEWPSLAAAPGVWYRLTCQALLGLATAHQAGLVHGGIGPHSVVLTSDGLVKIAGVGEPAWLTGADPNATAHDDVIALGQLAANWAALTPKRKVTKTPRPLPTALRQTLDRWAAGEFATAGDVLDALDRAGQNIPSGAETWDRLMRYAGANATDGVAWRKSA